MKTVEKIYVLLFIGVMFSAFGQTHLNNAEWNVFFPRWFYTCLTMILIGFGYLMFKKK